MDGILFKDRESAGRALADAYDGPREDVTVFGIARGGIPIAYPIAADVGGFDQLRRAGEPGRQHRLVSRLRPDIFPFLDSFSQLFGFCVYRGRAERP